MRISTSLRLGAWAALSLALLRCTSTSPMQSAGAAGPFGLGATSGATGASGGGAPDAGSLPDGATDADASMLPEAGSRTSNCFPVPGACGFPDPEYGNVGVPPGAALTASGSIKVTKPGTMVQNLDITGSIDVAANDTTIKNVRLTSNDHGSGSAAISIEKGVTGTTIEDSTVRGSGAVDSPESAVFNHYGAPLMLTRVYLYNFADPIEGPVTAADCFINSNGSYGSGNDISHIEGIYASDDTVTVTHSVLLNPSDQTATVFMDTNGGSGNIPGDDNLTITDSLLAGGGYTLYPSAKSTSAGAGKMNISTTRFARCLSKGVFDGSGTTCKDGPDSHGYFPNSGYYGVAAGAYCPPTGGQTWSGNVWDDDDSAVDCP